MAFRAFDSVDLFLNVTQVQSKQFAYILLEHSLNKNGEIRTCCPFRKHLGTS